jgi:hypothetical protein
MFIFLIQFLIDTINQPNLGAQNALFILKQYPYFKHLINENYQ